jgi:glucose-6-phosphate isomerase
MRGRSAEELQAAGVDAARIPHMVFEGNRPATRC